MTAADDAIRGWIDSRKSFLLDAAAGSGKTTSLIEALRHLIYSGIGTELAKNSQRIACITYTNIAKDEIIDRTAHSPLIHVATIHDFLWSVLKSHQSALKAALLQHNAELKEDSARKRNQEELAAALTQVSVGYSDRGPEFLEGRIFHDDLLDISRRMFMNNSLLSHITAARYPYLFVDEYQDTSVSVIDILLDHVLAKNQGKVVLGFFGDKFQSIYDSGIHPGIGEIPLHQQQRLERITKSENYRCSIAVINFLNKIRTDIKQFPAGENLKGQAVYIRLMAGAPGQDVRIRVREFVHDKLGWPTDGEIKDLFLTHKLIAKKAGYENLLNVYQERGGFYRDQALKGEDKFINLFREVVEPLIADWHSGRIGEVITRLRQNGFQLGDNAGKARAKNALDKLVSLSGDLPVGDLLTHIMDTGLLVLSDELKQSIEDYKAGGYVVIDLEDKIAVHRGFLCGLMKLPYKEVSGFCEFLEEHTPFSTQHGVKGAEFDTVFVYLDDKGARWNLYSFDKYLSGEDEANNNLDRMRRTRNLFYVCCSRTKRNLAVVDLGGSSNAKDKKLKELFGTESCFF